MRLLGRQEARRSGNRAIRRSGQKTEDRGQKADRGKQMKCKLVSRMVNGTCAHSAGVNNGVNKGVNNGVNTGVNTGVNNLHFNANYRIDGTSTATTGGRSLKIPRRKCPP